MEMYRLLQLLLEPKNGLYSLEDADSYVRILYNSNHDRQEFEIRGTVGIGTLQFNYSGGYLDSSGVMNLYIGHTTLRIKDEGTLNVTGMIQMLPRN